MGYARLLTARSANLQREVFALHARLVKEGNEAQAVRVRAAFYEFEDTLVRIGQQIAKSSRTTIAETLDRTRVRPPTEGFRPQGDKGLATGIRSHPLPAAPGSVGVARLEDLDAGFPWWRAQEFGTGANVGRMVYGYFQGPNGRSRPSQQQVREHPVFAPSQPGQRMIIQNPIPAKRFLEKGSAEVEAQWHALIAPAKAKLIREMQAAVAGAKRRPTPRPGVRPAPGSRRRRP